MKTHLDIQALLFAGAQSMTVKELSDALAVGEDGIEDALTTLTQTLEGSALMLVRNVDEITLVTRPEHSAVVEKMRKEELSKELSKASAETLSVVVYYPGVSKTQIEFIRGVNATYSLRALAMRGLVELRGAGRVSGYHPTTQLLEHYGISSLEQLPGYAEQHAKIKSLLEGAVETV